MKKVTAREAMKQCVIDAIGIAPKESDVPAIGIELFRWRVQSKDNGILTKKEEYQAELRRKWDLSTDEAYIVEKAIDSVCGSNIHLKEDDIVVDKEHGTIWDGATPLLDYRRSAFG